jgi:hypothetical protein
MRLDQSLKCRQFCRGSRRCGGYRRRRGRVTLLRKSEERSIGDSRAEVVGWYDEHFAYLVPEAARRAVAAFVRESGDNWPYTPTALHRALVSAGVVVPGPDGRPETQARVGGAKRRVLKMHLAALRPDDGESAPSPLSPPPDPTSTLLERVT